MAMDRCIDCRSSFCNLHGSHHAEFVVETLIADVGGVHAHWAGPVNTYDGAFRCVPCLTKRAHAAFSDAALRGGAKLPPLPDDHFLKCCVIAAGGFDLRDPSLDRSLPEFARHVHRVASAHKIPMHRWLFRGTTKQPASWRLPYGSGPGGDYSIHVFADGSFAAEPWHGGELAEAPDAAFASVALMFGLGPRP